ncbi:hypothetical protein TRVA0_022S00782 [Trichomonascus vanleenenianus]|uniref:uncharacterized protein n=1 Tax=Trichomonascus vanleenenianus TaxID=2268995 RepID=UPI003ECA2130
MTGQQHPLSFQNGLFSWFTRFMTALSESRPSFFSSFVSLISHVTGAWKEQQKPLIEDEKEAPKKSVDLFPKMIEIDESLDSSEGPVPCATDSTFNLVQMYNQAGNVIGWDVGTAVDGPVLVSEHQQLQPQQMPASYEFHDFKPNGVHSITEQLHVQPLGEAHFPADYLGMYPDHTTPPQQPILQRQPVQGHHKLVMRTSGKRESFSPYTKPSASNSIPEQPIISNNHNSDLSRSDSMTSSDHFSFTFESPQQPVLDLEKQTPPELHYSNSPPEYPSHSTPMLDAYAMSLSLHHPVTGAIPDLFPQALAFNEERAGIVNVNSTSFGVYPPAHSRATSENGDTAATAAGFDDSTNAKFIIEDLYYLDNAPVAHQQIQQQQQQQQHHHHQLDDGFFPANQISPQSASPQSSPSVMTSPEFYSYPQDTASITSADSAAASTAARTNSTSPMSGGDQPFACPECPASFRIKGYLTRHMKKHAVRKAYNCPFYDPTAETPCHPTGGFSRRDTYKTHLKARHFIYPAGTRSEHRGKVSGTCAGCDQTFDKNETWVEDHIQKGLCVGVLDQL